MYIGYNKLDVDKDLNSIRIMRKSRINDFEPSKNLFVTMGHAFLFKNLENINKYYDEKNYYNNIKGYYKINAHECKLCNFVKKNELYNVIENDNTVRYYHFCLENDDYAGQYGIYSNNVLTETLPINFIKISNLIPLKNNPTIVKNI